jgi:uncharacterized protein (TIGR03437 family)
VDFDGAPASLLLTSPFQLNVVIPSDLAPGAHTLRVQSPYGSAQQPVTVLPVAPAIFEVGNLGAVTNQDNTLNTPSNPATRGQAIVVYCTGLGVAKMQGGYIQAVTPVTVVLNGQELPVSFAGPTAPFPGLYQVNVVIPASTPPSGAANLTLKQGGQMSNTVPVAIQ